MYLTACIIFGTEVKMLSRVKHRNLVGEVIEVKVSEI